MKSKTKTLLMEIGLFLLIYVLAIGTIAMSKIPQTAFSFESVASYSTQLTPTIYILTFCLILIVYGIFLIYKRRSK